MLLRLLDDFRLGALDAQEGQDPVDGGAAGDRVVPESLHDLRRAKHALLVVGDDLDGPPVRQTGEETEGPVIGRGIEGDPLDAVAPVLEGVGEIAEQGGMGVAGEDGLADLVGEVLEGLPRPALDLVVGVVGQREERRRELDGGEGQGAAGRHPAHLEGSIAARVLFRLGREVQPDLLGFRHDRTLLCLDSLRPRGG